MVQSESNPKVMARPAAVAGTFYPSDAHELGQMIDTYLSEAARRLPRGQGRVPSAIIAPHAGIRYSGPIAASAFHCVAPLAGDIKRVVLLGPTHFVSCSGLVAPTVEAFETPFGATPIDHEAIELLMSQCENVHRDDFPHRREHSLEVLLPFVQRIFNDCRIVPLLVGDASTEEIAAVLNTLWHAPETLVCVSSDLSHFHSYDEAVQIDRGTAESITRGRIDRVGPNEACGYRAIRGLLTVAAQRSMPVQIVDSGNSGDTAGPRDRVVGYGAFTIG